MNFLNLFKTNDAYLGIDIGAGGMKLVELRKTKNRPQLWTYGLLDTPLDIHVAEVKPVTANPVKSTDKKETIKSPPDPRVEKYGAFLKHLVEQSRATTLRVTASLPVSHIFHAVVTLPHVPAKELDYHVRAKVSKMLPLPIEDMQVVHQPLGKINPEQKDLKIVVTAASKTLIRFYTDIFSYAGLTLDELETEVFALERSLVGRDQATVMVVDIGAERTNFFIVDQGQPVTHRSIALGGQAIDAILQQTLGVDMKLIPQIKYDLARSAPDRVSPSLFSSITDPILKEIQYGFDLYLHQSGNEQKHPEKIILTGGAALFPPLVASLQAAFDTKVFVGDPWARVVYQQKLKPTLDAIAPRMSVAIGLALRNLVSVSP